VFFLARSADFSQRRASSAGVSMHPSAHSAQQPWFVLVLLNEQESAASWETVCASRHEDLIDYLSARPHAQLAELFCMAPPRGSAHRRWSQQSIT